MGRLVSYINFDLFNLGTLVLSLTQIDIILFMPEKKFSTFLSIQIHWYPNRFTLVDQAKAQF